MEKILGFSFNKVDSKNRVVIPEDIRNKITGDIGSVIIKESIMRIYDIQKLYDAIEKLEKGYYSVQGEENIKRLVSDLCTLYSNLDKNIKIRDNGRILLPGQIAKQVGSFNNVNGERMMKIIGEGYSIALVPNQDILYKYEDGLYGTSLIKR